MPTSSHTGAPEIRLARHHRAVDRVTTILEHAVASSEGLTLSDLTQLLQAPKSSLHGLVQGLLAVGYLRETPTGRLVIGPGVQSLTGFLRMPELVRLGREHIEELSKLSGETTMLGTRIGNHIVYQSEAASQRQIRYVPSLHQRRPMLTTALGRVFLASLTQADLAQVLADEGPVTESLDELEAALADIRRDGFAFNHGMSVPGLVSVAAPILGRDGLPLAGITVAGPTERMTEQLESISEALLRACHELSTRAHGVDELP